MFRLFLGSGQRILINLNRVQHLSLDKKSITLQFGHKPNIVGSAILFSGGDEDDMTFTYKSENDAEEEFDSIVQQVSNKGPVIDHSPL